MVLGYRWYWYSHDGASSLLASLRGIWKNYHAVRLAIQFRRTALLLSSVWRRFGCIDIPLVSSAKTSLINQRTFQALPVYKIFTARAAISATVASEIKACTIIISLAHRDSTGTSVGEKAVLVLKARNK